MKQPIIVFRVIGVTLIHFARELQLVKQRSRLFSERRKMVAYKASSLTSGKEIPEILVCDIVVVPKESMVRHSVFAYTNLVCRGSLS